jgi:hypothetical protein
MPIARIVTHWDLMLSRAAYVVHDVTDAAQVCRAVFAVLRDDIETVRIDAYSDYVDQMPEDIRRAEAWLRARGLLGADRDPGAAIQIGRDDDVGWEIARAYALWSTHVRLLDGTGTTIASLDDGAHAVTVELSDVEREALTDAVGAAATVAAVSSADEIGGGGR